MVPAISGSMGAPPGHGIGNGLQMAGKDFIAGESGNESVRRSFNGPTKRHINGPAIDGGSSCPKGGFS